ncbi:MAG: hypothetical protein ACPLXM_04280, partial [Bacteroidales bacterium]
SWLSWLSGCRGCHGCRVVKVVEVVGKEKLVSFSLPEMHEYSFPHLTIRGTVSTHLLKNS